MGVAIMADYNYMKMTAEEIENLFLTTEMHPNSPEGERALHVLAIKYKRMDAERSRRALWISIIALIFSFLSILVNVGKAEEPKYPIMSINALGIAGDYPNTMNTIGCKLC
ncbi:MAG: hypothetical protein R6V60_09795 [Desulfobacterales bacterium]